MSLVEAGCKIFGPAEDTCWLVSVPFMCAEVRMNLPVCERRGVFLHCPDVV